jgi:hypothetical protein
MSLMGGTLVCQEIIQKKGEASISINFIAFLREIDIRTFPALIIHGRWIAIGTGITGYKLTTEETL